jgi:hypothetical protein
MITLRDQNTHTRSTHHTEDQQTVTHVTLPTTQKLHRKGTHNIVDSDMYNRLDRILHTHQSRGGNPYHNIAASIAAASYLQNDTVLKQVLANMQHQQ